MAITLWSVIGKLPLNEVSRHFGLARGFAVSQYLIPGVLGSFPCSVLSTPPVVIPTCFLRLTPIAWAQASIVALCRAAQFR